MERGEIDPDNPAAEFVATQLICVMRFCPMLGGSFADETYLTRFLEAAILPGLGLRVATP